MSTKKITKRENYNTLLGLDEVKSNSTLVEFINHEIELLDRKNSKDKKPSANQVANEGIKGAIIEFMEDGVQYTITDINKGCEVCADLSNQRISALVRQLKDEGKVVREEIKGKAYFSKVA